MGIVLTFAFNAGLNFALGLAVASVLGPAEYGRFALASMLAIVLATALFEWLRLSTTRFIGHGEASASRIPSLEAGYMAVALLLLATAASVEWIGYGAGLTGVPLMIVALAAITTARFEYRSAEARALFLDRVYLRLVISRGLLALGLMLAAAFWFRAATPVLVMLAVSAACASMLGPRRPGGARLADARRADLLAFARYGLPIVGATLVYQVSILVNRSVAADAFGLAEAGRLSLATDITLRLLVSVGAALDALLFQVAVRRRAEDGHAAGQRQLASNMLVMAAVLAFLGLCYVIAMPALEAIFVPAAYRGSFGALATILVPGVLAFCFLQFGLNPIFQLAGGTAVLLWTAFVAVGVDLALVWFMPRALGLDGLAWAHLGALVAGALAACLQASRVKDCWPSLRDGFGLLAALALSGLAMWPFRAIENPWLSILGTGVAGGIVLGLVLLALDVAGWRGILLGRLGARRRQPA